MESLLVLYCSVLLIIGLYATVFINLIYSRDEPLNNRQAEQSHLISNIDWDSEDDDIPEKSDEPDSKDFFTINIRENYVVDKSR